MTHFLKILGNIVSNKLKKLENKFQNFENHRKIVRIVVSKVHVTKGYKNEFQKFQILINVVLFWKKIWNFLALPHTYHAIEIYKNLVNYESLKIFRGNVP